MVTDKICGSIVSRKGAHVLYVSFPITSWNDTIQNPTIADVILDYLIYSAHKINLKGELMRKIRSSLTIDNNSEK